jgi:tetratricopeptide (TPR) repeat protein
MFPLLTESAARWFSVVVSFGAGLALIAYGLHIRLGHSRGYYLKERKGLLRPSVYHILPLIGVVLCLLGFTGLFSDLETRQRLLVFLVTPAALVTVLIGPLQPSWLKPSWLSRLQKKNPDIYRFLAEVALEQVADDPEKAAEWIETMGTAQAQDEWVARVRKSRGWPRRELSASEQPSIKVPRRFRQQIAKVQQLPPSSGGLEKQIEIYREMLSQLKRGEEPAFWASLQNKLGIAYAARRRGNRADNLEKAISAYEAACEVTKQKGLLVDWAMSQNNLGAALRKRIRGDKAENLEKAISAYESALEVFNREEYPSYWAGTQSSLGFAYSQRKRGERRENLGQAIAAYEGALEVYTESEHPEQRAQMLEQLEKARQALEEA